MQTEINLPFITADASGPKHLRMTLTGPRLEQLTDDLIERTIDPVQQALKDAKLTADVDEVILVGGMTRMPAVQDAVARSLARSRTRASTRTRSWPLALPSRPGCWGARSKMCCCWT